MNSILSLAIILFVFTIAEMISNYTKARLSMIFIAGIAFLCLFWFGLPGSLFSSSGMIDFSKITLLMFMVHLGSSIRLKVFATEWKTAILSFFTTIGLALSVFCICSMIFNRNYALACAPVLSGGMAAYLTIKNNVEIQADNINAIMALILVFQTFIGLPLASIFLRKAAKRIILTNGQQPIKDEPKNESVKKPTRINKIRTVSSKYSNSFNSFGILCELAIISYVSDMLGKITNISGIIFALCFGILMNEFGILPENALVKANGFSFVLIGALCNIFDSLHQVSPEEFINMLGPLMIVFSAGLIGSTSFAFIFSKLLKIPLDLSIALSTAAYFGFPATYLVPTEIANTISNNPDEQKTIKDYLLPKMVLSGIVSMSMVSVILAAVSTQFFH